MLAVSVPCGGCTACCKGEAVYLVPGDAVASYLVEMSPGGKGLVLQRKANGECVYLDASGCTIHDRAPTLCKVYDCRRQYQMYSRLTRRKMQSQGLLDAAVMEAGRKRVHTLGSGG